MSFSDGELLDVKLSGERGAEHNIGVLEVPGEVDRGVTTGAAAVPLARSGMRKGVALGAEFVRMFKRRAPGLLASGLRVSVSYTFILAAWNVARGSGEDIPKYQRELRELGASGVLGAVVPLLETIFNELLGRLKCLPRFEGDIGYIAETFKGIIGALWGAATVAIAVGVAEHDLVHSKLWLFLAWPISFFLAQNGMDGLNLLFGKEMLLEGSSSASSWGGSAKRGVIKGIKGLGDRNVWLRRMLPYFFAHYLHHHYADPMLAWTDETAVHYLYLGIACFFFFSSAKLLFTAGEFVTAGSAAGGLGQSDLEGGR